MAFELRELFKNMTGGKCYSSTSPAEEDPSAELSTNSTDPSAELGTNSTDGECIPQCPLSKLHAAEW